MTKLSGREIADGAPAGWVYMLGALHARLRTGDFPTGLALVAAIGAAAEAADHHPDLDLRYTYVDVWLASHDVGAVTGRDLRLAATISKLAEQAGVTVDPAGPVRIEMALDTPDHRKVLPFWAAVLGADQRAEEDFADEVRRDDRAVPPVWFQKSGSEEPRQRWHPDVWLDPSQVQPRIEAALAAGGTLVSDAEAPAFWVLADPEGNRMCLCTSQERQ
ncbi:VOC family protein [Actinoplanes sp. NEAU-A12]|uniref:Putative pterin-4-alpha-carbinolamine dehydratase n=1 Tax=Actinoplanes sandaracinus TaxID=3045177 RepID=A0ABT6WJY6_9ACTN|nr:VOC family protein [Actinoplanes sandaracinus]MDI6100050.1 VOC family protein [Actinoplanes sandaracinus]